MRLFTHNLLVCNVKACVATAQRTASAQPSSFPLRIEVAADGMKQEASEFHPEATARLLSKLDWPALRATADALAAARKWPIFSSQNVLAAAWEGLPADAPRPCVVPHDAYAAALEGADYGRFYEFWMGNGKNIDAAYIANVVLEGARGVGFVARASADAGAQCPAACDLSPYHPVDLNYALAAFMVARTSPWSYFGVSGGWSSGCWCWHAQYDEAAKCGAPLAPAVRTSPYSWTREYQRCSVAVNTSDGTGALSPK